MSVTPFTPNVAKALSILERFLFEHNYLVPVRSVILSNPALLEDYLKDFSKRFRDLEQEVYQLNNEIGDLNDQLSSLQESLESLRSKGEY